uniref:Uncharacterized protein n=1 Tax=Lotharella globosa TaxID=91324 RepID=A0A7S3ZEE0_9EUKA
MDAPKDIDMMAMDIRKNAHFCSQAHTGDVKMVYLAKMDATYIRLKNYLLSNNHKKPMGSREVRKPVVNMNYSNHMSQGTNSTSYGGQYYYGQQRAMQQPMRFSQPVSRTAHPEPMTTTASFAQKAPSMYLGGTSNYGMNPSVTSRVPVRPQSLETRLLI